MFPTPYFFRQNWSALETKLKAAGIVEPTMEFAGDEDTGYFQVSLPDVAAFGANQLYGLCGCCVLSDLYVLNGLGHKGIGRAILDFAEKSICEAGYALILGSTNEGMKRMNTILPLRGWSIKRTFVNARTMNECYLWTKRLMSATEAQDWFDEHEDD